MSKESSSRDSSSISELTMQTYETASNTGDYEKLIAELKKQVLALQSKNAALKRAVPRMLDIERKDITSEVQRLCNELAISEESNEEWQNKFAESEQRFSRFQRTTSEELNSRDQQITRLKMRAKALEEENIKLSEQVVNDLSRIHHLENNQDGIEQNELTLGQFENDQNSEDIEHLKEELATKLNTNKDLVQKLAEAEEKVANLKILVDQKDKIIMQCSKIRGFEDDSIFTLPKPLNATYSDVDYVIAEIMVILQHLQGNLDSVDSLREDILTFLRDHGFSVDRRNVVELEKGLEGSMKAKFDVRRNQIKHANKEIAGHCRLDNEELAKRLKQLSEDSVFTVSRQPPVDSQQTSFCENFGRSAARTDILNKTVDVAEDLGAVIDRMDSLQLVCHELFGKLRGTAEFLTSLLEHLEDSEDGRELLQKINEIKLDLEKSFGEAKFLVEQVKKAEKVVIGFRGMLQHTLDQSLEESSRSQAEVPQSQVAASGGANEAVRQEVERLKVVEERCEALESTLKNEMMLKESLEEKLAELQKQIVQSDAHFKGVIDGLDAKLSAEKLNTACMYRAIEEKNRAIGTFEKIGKEKDLIIASRDRECAELNRLLLVSNESSQLAKMQVLELSNKCQNVVQFSKEQKMQIDDKVGLIAELEAELHVLRKQAQDLAGRQDRTSVNLERKLIALSRENSDLKEKVAELQSKVEIMASGCERRDAIVAKSNNLFYSKIVKDFPDINNIGVGTDTGETQESVSGFDEFTSFLADCRDRSNNLVQLVKKADTASAALGNSIPYLQNMINETRAIRMMLHKIANFFKNQKENFRIFNSKFGMEIHAELEKIYEALQTVVQSSQSDDLNARKPVARDINYVRRQ